MRAPDSLRRTSTIDMLWPGGLGRELTLRGRARDLRTDSEGRPSVLDEAELMAQIDYGAFLTLRKAYFGLSLEQFVLF